MNNSIRSRISASPILGLIIGILAASTASIFIRFAQIEAPSLVIAALRLSLATLILAPIAIIKNRNELIGLTSKQLFFLVLAGLFLAFHFATWISSLEYTSVASSVVLVTTSPIWVSLLAPILLKETLSKKSIIGLLIALTGSFLVSLAQGCSFSANGLECQSLSLVLTGKEIWGNFLALVGAWCAAGYLIIGRNVRRSISLVSYSFIVYGIAALTLLTLVAILGLNLDGYSPALYGWCLLLAVLPQLIGHTSFNWALKFVPASIVSLVLLGEPVASILLAILFLKETPTIFEIVGGVVILTGITIASRSD